MAVVRLAELTRRQMAHRTEDVLVLPVGSTEQHGPHLPMGTDMMLAASIADSATADVGDRVDVVLAPSLSYGMSEHHVFAGAASLKPATYQLVVLDLLRSLTASGFSRFFILNGHGGNHDSLNIVAKSAPLDIGASVAVCSYWNTVTDELGDLDMAGCHFPGHAGMFETSLMLAVSPDLVDTTHAPTAAPDPPPVWARPPHPGLDVQLPDEWPRVGGYSDPSTHADSGIGREIFTRASREVARAIERFAQVTEQHKDTIARHGTDLE